MARYELRVKPSVAKDLRGLPKADVPRILARIEALRDDPRAPGCEKLAGGSELYRVRQGVYRVVYTIDDERVIVEVVRVGHRGEVHRARQSRVPTTSGPKPPYPGHRQRLGEQFFKSGLDSLAEHEVTELVLTLAIPRSDVNRPTKASCTRTCTRRPAAPAGPASCRRAQALR